MASHTKINPKNSGDGRKRKSKSLSDSTSNKKEKNKSVTEESVTEKSVSGKSSTQNVNSLVNSQAYISLMSKNTYHSQRLRSDFQTKPLLLVCNNKNTKNKWNVVLNDINRRSFGGYLSNPFSTNELDLWWNLMTDKNSDIKWARPKLNNGRYLPRKAAWLVSRDCKCCYRYSQTKWTPIIFPKWFEKITQRVIAETGLKFEYMPNSCNINWYENGNDSVGWHSDDEALFQSKFDDCLIISLSLGQSRKFEITAAQNYTNRIINEKSDITQVILNNGDLMTMEGSFQKYYLHRVPKSYNIDKPRINFTWRWIKIHDIYRDHCTLSTHKGHGHVEVLENK